MIQRSLSCIFRQTLVFNTSFVDPGGWLEKPLRPVGSPAEGSWWTEYLHGCPVTRPRDERQSRHPHGGDERGTSLPCSKAGEPAGTLTQRDGPCSYLCRLDLSKRSLPFPLFCPFSFLLCTYVQQTECIICFFQSWRIYFKYEIYTISINASYCLS